MKLVFIYGPPASGKLTVARELAALTGYKLFHNHLAVDALGAVFEFGSEPFVELRERIWVDVMTAASAAGIDGLIFTFAPERSVRDGFIDALGGAVAAPSSVRSMSTGSSRQHGPSTGHRCPNR